MNKHLSVLGLWARQTMGKILALLAVMAAAETALFAWALSQELTRDIMDNQTCPAPVEDLFDFAKIDWVYRIAVILLLVLLILSGTELKGGRLGYTLRRLRISEEAAVLWQSGYHMVCLALLWAVQAALALGFCLWYAGTTDPAYISDQSAFLAFYRSGFLHGLLPLANVLRWGYIMISGVALGITSAMFGYHQRHGRKGIAGFVALALTLWTYAVPAGELGIIGSTSVMLAVVTIWQLFTLWTAWKGGGIDEEDGK